MIAWVSRFNGQKPDSVGTDNNTIKMGDLKEILLFAASYGKGFQEVLISIHFDESNKYGEPDKIITLFPH